MPPAQYVMVPQLMRVEKSSDPIITYYMVTKDYMTMCSIIAIFKSSVSQWYNCVK